jgi:hypothetical protein
MSSRRQARRVLRVRHTRVCQCCEQVISSKHHFANYLFSVLCRGCFRKWQVS